VMQVIASSMCSATSAPVMRVSTHPEYHRS
jgi:hypothetical protein